MSHVFSDDDSWLTGWLVMWFLLNHWINFHQLKKNRIFYRFWERINKTLKSAKRKIWAVWINWIRLNPLMMTHIPWVIVHDSFIWLIVYESWILTHGINVKWAMNKSLEFKILCDIVLQHFLKTGSWTGSTILPVYCFFALGSSFFKMSRVNFLFICLFEEIKVVIG